MFGFGSKSDTAAVLRKNRDACHRARDAYYACVDDREGHWKEGEVPQACKTLRKEFESSCKATWVRHFDRLRDREVKAARELNRIIDATASEAKGGTAGRPQR